MSLFLKRADTLNYPIKKYFSISFVIVWRKESHGTLVTMQMFMTFKRCNFVQEAFWNAKVDLKRTYQALQLICGYLLDYIPRENLHQTRR